MLRRAAPPSSHSSASASESHQVPLHAPLHAATPPNRPPHAPDAAVFCQAGAPRGPGRGELGGDRPFWTSGQGRPTDCGRGARVPFRAPFSFPRESWLERNFVKKSWQAPRRDGVLGPPLLRHGLRLLLLRGHAGHQPLHLLGPRVPPLLLDSDGRGRSRPRPPGASTLHSSDGARRVARLATRPRPRRAGCSLARLWGS